MHRLYSVMMFIAQASLTMIVIWHTIHNISYIIFYSTGHWEWETLKLIAEMLNHGSLTEVEQATLRRRPTVLSLPLQLVFPGWTKAQIKFYNICQKILKRKKKNHFCYPHLLFLKLCTPRTVLTTFHCIRNLQMGPVSQCYITLGWKSLQVTNTLAFWAHL